MSGVALAWVLFQLGVLALIVGIAVWGFFRWDRRYRGARGEDGFEPTEERFTDPTTGRPMRVYFNPSSGERQYREV